jgi:TPR repeat protein
MKHLIQVINRANFGRYSTNRFLAHVAARLEPLAQAGNGLALYRLGMLHWDGWGIPQNRERGLELLRAAAKAGVLNAAYNLAVAYDNGYSVAKSYYKAFGYYAQAARLGSVEAIHAVGSFHYWGQGVAQDYDKALHWYRKSAKRGYADGMCDLARCYQRGVGGPKNLHWAIYWFRKAVSEGCIRAQTWLGLAFASEPIEDWKLARHWLKRAAANQHSHAIYSLGIWAEEGWNDQQNIADATFWFQHAAALGHERAALRLAELHGETF